MPKLPLLFLVMSLTSVGCGKEEQKTQPSRSCNVVQNPGSANAAFSATDLFTVSPVDPSATASLLSLGNLNPPSHTISADHIYFLLTNTAANSTNVYAPAAGTVVEIKSGSSASDQGLRVRVDTSFDFFYGHITVASGIKEGDAVTAGQLLATNSGNGVAVDFGVYNYNQTRVENVFNACYQEALRYTDKPLKYFKEPLKTTLYAKVNRAGSDKDGKVGFDVEGKLAGYWVLSSETDPMGNWASQLAFAYDVITPTAMRVSIGGALAPALLYAVDPSSTEFGAVSTASGLVTYMLYDSNEIPALTTLKGTLLVQLTGANELKVEYFAGQGSAAAFTSKASTYLR